MASREVDNDMIQLMKRREGLTQLRTLHFLVQGWYPKHMGGGNDAPKAEVVTKRMLAACPSLVELTVMPVY